MQTYPYNEDESWKEFVSTGKISAYLEYKGITQANIEAVKNENKGGDSFVNYRC